MIKTSAGDHQHFNAEKEIRKYSIEVSTFDVIKLSDFHNYKCSTICWYLYMWIVLFLSIALLATDIYSCLNILVFHRWANDSYTPYAYSIAKWIFTGCIIFQFCLIIYHFIWAIHIYRTKNIALVYLNSIAKRFYSIKSYYYFCLLNSIDEGEFFDWCCFLTYYELDNALQILIADTPRQVINVLTLRYYATGGDLNNAILNNIKLIARTNLYLSIILSFMCLSVVIYAIFLFKFLFGMIMYTPIKCSIKDTKHNTLKKYCINLINKSVHNAVNLHHKSKKELLDQGLLSENRIANLPSLSSINNFDSASTINLYNLRKQPSLQDLSQTDSNSLYEKQQLYDSTMNNNSHVNRRLSLLNDKVRKQHYDDVPNYKQRQPSTSNLLQESTKPIKKPPLSYNQEFRSTSEQLNKQPERNFTDYSIETVKDPFIDNLNISTSSLTRQYDNPYQGIAQTTITQNLNNSTSSLNYDNHEVIPPRRIFTDEYPISEQEKEMKLAEMNDSNDDFDILDAYNSKNNSNESLTPYPIRGVSKYFEE
ncbi:unnamed protein product [Candida verbasci]|uniref:Vacuolar membrane protein n=1 Tax=Candida verbasci TaxID=1227364 RepID=A0A9W4U1D5_9ASCO|nr:unnamed protein product [Candida verbasci]